MDSAIVLSLFMFASPPPPRSDPRRWRCDSLGLHLCPQGCRYYSFFALVVLLFALPAAAFFFAGAFLVVAFFSFGAAFFLGSAFFFFRFPPAVPSASLRALSSIRPTASSSDIVSASIPFG